MISLRVLCPLVLLSLAACNAKSSNPNYEEIKEQIRSLLQEYKEKNPDVFPLVDPSINIDWKDGHNDDVV